MTVRRAVNRFAADIGANFLPFLPWAGFTAKSRPKYNWLPLYGFSDPTAHKKRPAG
jgi:hypothetical protein